MRDLFKNVQCTFNQSVGDNCECLFKNVQCTFNQTETEERRISEDLLKELVPFVASQDIYQVRSK